MMKKNNVIGLLIWPVCILLAIILLVYKWEFELHTAKRLGFWIGSLFYCLVIVPTCWKFVRGNVGIIYQNMFKGQREITNAQSLSITDTIQPPEGQIGIHAGPTFVPPWYMKIGEPIKMITDDKIDKVINCLDNENQGYNVTIFTNVNPAPGKWLPNYIRIPGMVALPYLESIIEQEVQQLFSKCNGEEVRAGQDTSFRKLVEKILGGSTSLSDHEKRTGRFTGEIIVKAVLPKPEAQKALEANLEMGKAAAIAKTAMKALRGLDPNTAYVGALSMLDKPVTLIGGRIGGFENLQSVGGQAVEAIQSIFNKGKKSPKK